MPTIYDLKPGFQRLLRPIVARLAARGITPNQITLAALGLSVGTGLILAVFAGYAAVFWFLPPVLLLRMALNAIDGMLAREHGMVTALGAYLNELGDLLSDIALYLPFACVAAVSLPLVIVFLAVAALSEMTGMVALQVGARRRYDGPFGKSDRAFAFGCLAAAIAAGVSPGPWIDGALVVLVFLSGLTVINRLRQALREVAHG